MDNNSSWPKIDTACPFKNFMSDAVCSLFKSSRWNELNICAFVIVEYRNPEILVFQHLLVKGKINNPYENNRLEECNRMRNCVIVDALISFDINEILESGAVFWKFLKVFSVII